MIIADLLGPIRLTAALLPRLLAQPRSTVLNVTSALAFLPKAQVPTYCATKAALHSYTQSLRFQLRHTAVQVIEIIPPGVQTGLRENERVNEPNAMPLDEYIAETMALLTEQPEATEIVVDATEPLPVPPNATACTSSAIPTSTRHLRPDRRPRCVAAVRHTRHCPRGRKDYEIAEVARRSSTVGRCSCVLRAGRAVVPESDDPMAAVRRYIDAFNNGDEKAMAAACADPPDAFPSWAICGLAPLQRWMRFLSRVSRTRSQRRLTTR